jgi:transposase
MHRTEVITVERRRRWSWGDKQLIVDETLMPGASISAVARRYGLHPSQVFAWRKEAREGKIAEQPGSGLFDCVFAPVVVTGGSAAFSQEAKRPRGQEAKRRNRSARPP